MRAIELGMKEILTVCAETLADRGKPVDLVSLSPGQATAWDNCCGQLYVRSVRIEPNSSSSVNRGILTMDHRVAVGVLREVGTVNSRGEPPTDERLDADTVQIMEDSYLLLTTLDCFKPKWSSKVKLVQWLPLGPMGGMAGGEWLVDLTYTAGHLRGR